MKKDCRKLFRVYRTGPVAFKNANWNTYKAKRNEYNSEIELSKKNSWVKYCNEIEGVTAMSRVHKLMAKDSLNMAGVLRHPNGDLRKSHEEAANLLLDTHFPGNVRVNTDDPSNRFRDVQFREETVTNEILTTERIHWALTSFEPYKSLGYDEIYPARGRSR